MPDPKTTSWFTRFAKQTSSYAGKPVTFAIAVLLLVVWAAFGPANHYDNTWQLVINTGTTIVTFLMVFLIQNSQNRDSQALQIKLDEIIRALGEANNRMLDLEDLDDEDLDKIRQKFLALAIEARDREDEDLDRKLDEKVDDKVNETIDKKLESNSN